MARNDIESWTGPAKLFHWLMALLIFVQIALGLIAVSWHISPTKLNLFVWHKSFGMLILALLALRLLWRLSHRAPPPPWGMPLWGRAAAPLSHFLPYALMLPLPLPRQVT